jgi:hypothetical protein
MGGVHQTSNGKSSKSIVEGYPDYTPALLIDVPCSEGMIGIGPSAESAWQAAGLIDLLRGLADSVALGLSRQGDISRRQQAERGLDGGCGKSGGDDGYRRRTRSRMFSICRRGEPLISTSTGNQNDTAVSTSSWMCCSLKLSAGVTKIPRVSPSTAVRRGTPRRRLGARQIKKRKEGPDIAP